VDIAKLEEAGEVPEVAVAENKEEGK